MAVSPDIISEIQNYRPTEKGPIGQTQELGVVNDEYYLSYGLQHIQRRAVYLPGQPKISGEYTTQPGLRLTKREDDGTERNIALIDQVDIEALGEKLAAEVWYRIIDARCPNV